MDFTANWLWPQWTFAIMLLLGLMISTAQHGNPRLQTTGPDKGKPELYNGFTSIIKVALWVGILTAGGFFR